jgi:hypothetical protein
VSFVSTLINQGSGAVHERRKFRDGRSGHLRRVDLDGDGTLIGDREQRESNGVDPAQHRRRDVRAPSAVRRGCQSWSVALGDLDGDGDVDLVAVSASSSDSV